MLDLIRKMQNAKRKELPSRVTPSGRELPCFHIITEVVINPVDDQAFMKKSQP